MELFRPGAPGATIRGMGRGHSFSVARRLYRLVIDHLPDRHKRAIMYFRHFGGRPHADDPRTFNQKINWRVLNDRRPAIAMMADKLATKERVRTTCSYVRVPRTYWAGTDLDELVATELPDRWVLKSNHSSQRVYVGRGAPDAAALRAATAGWLEESLYEATGEWAYSQARPLLLAEEFIGDSDTVPADYKLHVFHGVVRLIEVDTDRFGDHQRRLYDGDWVPLPHLYGDGATLAPAMPAPPAFDMLKSVAVTLAAELDYVRVDLYDVEGVIWFGEMTACPAAGLDGFTPADLDEELGRYWTLPMLAKTQRVTERSSS
jgi:hypothetical protein